MAFSNREIASLAGQIFAHTAAFQAPAMFANRDDSRQALASFLDPGRRDRRILLISDLLGSGKTFLMDLVIGQLQLAESKPLICGKNKPKVMAERARFGAIFIDEWDIKASPRTIVSALAALEEYLPEARVPMVLIGDNTLKGDGIRRRLGSSAEVHPIPMEQLNPAFFTLALDTRLEYTAKRRELEPILAPELQAAIVPNWPQSVATFREVLSTLSQMAGHLPVNDEPCRMGEAEAVKWLAELPMEGLGDRRIAFYRRYLDALRERGAGIAPMSLEELQALAPNERDQADFFREVVEPLARGGLIGALGNPTFSEDGMEYFRYPGPYLPTVKTMVRLTYGGQS
ncbi:hypothetical protein [Azospirillum griseum]|uniref:ATP-binding protein n=1 Tax=Azospirillum griseum TaxID=2496639 RepID=A0A431VA61_9PROT|nr:hypothetical protein [Azospirillum griseum]RTR13448.1 hypothetical protein EJ903_24660 [Azospirillum griseum]